jgi:large subunit ribosomal protein L25
LPKGVELLALQQGADHDLPVAAIVIPRGMKEEEEAPAAAEGEKAEGAGE